MCNWHWSISYFSEEEDKRIQLSSIGYQGGVRAVEASKEKTLAKALRHASGWANANPQKRDSIIITNFSCNGDHERVLPFLESGPLVEPPQDWDEASMWFDEEEEQAKECVVWSASEDGFISVDLNINEARSHSESR